MANPGNLNNPTGSLLTLNPVAPAPFTLVPATGAVVSTLVLNPNLPYTLAHDGETETGSSATASIYFTFDIASGNGTVLNTLPNFTPTQASSLYPKLKLLNGRSVVIGPNIPNIYFCISGNLATIPTFTIAPGTNVFGQI